MAQPNPTEFYSGEALEVAEAIQKRDRAALGAILKKKPTAAAGRGHKNLPLLGWAMLHKDSVAFESLLKAGASPNDFMFVHDTKMSLLSLATGADRAEFFDLLLKYKADPNGVPETEPPLFTARFAGASDRFERLLQAGADINRSDITGKTILLVSVLANDYQAGVKLVARGANPRVTMANGTTIPKIIARFPLPADTPQGRAQAEMAELCRRAP